MGHEDAVLQYLFEKFSDSDWENASIERTEKSKLEEDEKGTNC